MCSKNVGMTSILWTTCPRQIRYSLQQPKIWQWKFWKKLHSSQVRQQTRRSCEFVTLAFSTVWKKLFKKKWVQNLLTSQSSCQKMALVLHAKEVTLLKKCLSEIKFEISSNSFFKIVFLLTCIQKDKFDQRQEQSQPRGEIHPGVKSYACV